MDQYHVYLMFIVVFYDVILLSGIEGSFCCHGISF